MENDQASIDPELKRALERVRRHRFVAPTTIFLSLIPVVVGLVFLLVGYRELHRKEEELKDRELKIKSLGLVLQNVPAAILDEAYQEAAGSDSAFTLLPSRVYIKVSNDNQRELAMAAGSRLVQIGYVVQVTQVADDTVTPDDAELRYFHDDQQAQDELADITAALSHFKVRAQPRLVVGQSAAPGRYELWLPKPVTKFLHAVRAIEISPRSIQVEASYVYDGSSGAQKTVVIRAQALQADGSQVPGSSDAASQPLSIGRGPFTAKIVIEMRSDLPGGGKADFTSTKVNACVNVAGPSGGQNLECRELDFRKRWVLDRDNGRP